MLSKVLKYDLKFVYKVLLVFYSLVIFFAILTRLCFSFENSFILNILANIFSGFTISFMFSILINNLMRLWARFIKNCYSDESYLTHTLPINKKTIYASKFSFCKSFIIFSTSIGILILLTAFLCPPNIFFGARINFYYIANIYKQWNIYFCAGFQCCRL